jgi:hypothetical protein
LVLLEVSAESSSRAGCDLADRRGGNFESVADGLERHPFDVVKEQHGPFDRAQGGQIGEIGWIDVKGGVAAGSRARDER